jgi:hypothetical protein
VPTLIVPTEANSTLINVALNQAVNLINTTPTTIIPTDLPPLPDGAVWTSGTNSTTTNSTSKTSGTGTTSTSINPSTSNEPAKKMYCN